MSQFTDAFDELQAVYRETTGQTPTVTIRGETAPIIPGNSNFDPIYLAGGTGNSGEIVLQVRVDALTFVPEKMEPATLAGLATGNDILTILSVNEANGTYMITLGDISASNG